MSRPATRRGRAIQQPALIVGAERGGRVFLVAHDGDLAALLRELLIPSIEAGEGRTIRRNRLADVWACAEYRGWRVIESRGRRDARPAA